MAVRTAGVVLGSTVTVARPSPATPSVGAMRHQFTMGGSASDAVHGPDEENESVVRPPPDGSVCDSGMSRAQTMESCAGGGGASSASG